jgi:hypothetical protein
LKLDDLTSVAPGLNALSAMTVQQAKDGFCGNHGL